MNIRYKNDLNHSHMIIEGCNTSSKTFSIRMLETNSIPALLQFSCEQIDGNVLYYYDISGKQSFEKLFETEKMSGRMLEAFLASLKQLAGSISEYLLEGEDVVFIPKCIFTEYNRDTFLFCCAPGSGTDQIADIRDLINMILSVIDYNDPKAVSLAFSLSSAVRSDFFTISSLADIDSTDSQNMSVRYYHPNPPLYDETWENAQAQDKTEAAPSAGENISPSGSKSRKSAKKSRKKKKTEPEELPADEQESFRFRDKARTYFKGRSFSEVYDDMNSGTIIRKIQNVQPEVQAAFPFFTAEEISRANAADPMPQPSFNILMDESKYMTGNKGNLTSEAAESTDRISEIRVPKSQVSSDPFDPDEATARLDIPAAYRRKLEGGGDLSGITAPLDHFPFTIGKGTSGCDLRLDSRTVSRIHCRIYSDPDVPDTYFLEDQNSTNGTYLNSSKLEPYSRQKLAVGDQIRLAREELYFL